MLRYLVAAILVSLSLLIAAVAAAEESGLYMGFGLGKANNTGGGFDAESSLIRPFVGYSVNQYFMAELAYVDPQAGSNTVDSNRVTIDARGTIVAGLVNAPLSQRWSIFGKLGWAFYHVDQTIMAGNVRLSERSNDNDLVFGVGTTLKLSDRWRVRLDYEAIDVPDGDFDSITLSGFLQF